ncbi:MAG: polyprenyl diphosphate synthase [Candidatus Aenigmatarchaeota archaeon]
MKSLPNGLIIPNHLGIIIDGNRRWAKKRGMPAWYGHRYGAKTLENFLKWCLELNIPHVSIFTLSTENLNRPKRELEELFRIYYNYLKKWEKKKDGFLDKYEVRVKFIGDLSRLPKKLVRLMGKLMQKTAKYQKRFLNLLVAYGSHFEIKEVVKKIVQKCLEKGTIEISEKDIQENLLVPVPLDLVIRTGGYNRLSNFMLLQASYAEIITLKKLWPDFTKQDLINCIKKYSRIQRNFGK